MSNARIRMRSLYDVLIKAGVDLDSPLGLDALCRLYEDFIAEADSRDPKVLLNLIDLARARFEPTKAPRNQ